MGVVSELELTAIILGGVLAYPAISIASGYMVREGMERFENYLEKRRTIKKESLNSYPENKY